MPIGRRTLALTVKKRAIFAPFIYKHASFYQDRLGTNIGKSLKKEWLRFLLQGRQRAVTVRALQHVQLFALARPLFIVFSN